ncbi:hypothetical protein A3Q56_07118 [Intoshia linei]|uniref:Uncharacterized protein n=1 Tax=Intoshia linei TaxID=1819745 RepID=A0A177AT49_9BILA|nr:hypothetical protein A3Q56_07118 [Intoshia linei]
MIIEQYNIAMDRLVKTRENIKNQLTYVE